MADDFQGRVATWLNECFGREIALDGVERNHRFLEEALELVQSLGCTESEARQLVGYVFSRPAGEPAQEVGGSIVTLAALCYANGIYMPECGETELARIWTKVEKIRAKQAAKPKHSPLAEIQEDKDATIATLRTEAERREAEDRKVVNDTIIYLRAKIEQVDRDIDRALKCDDLSGEEGLSAMHAAARTGLHALEAILGTLSRSALIDRARARAEAGGNG